MVYYELVLANVLLRLRFPLFLDTVAQSLGLEVGEIY